MRKEAKHRCRSCAGYRKCNTMDRTRGERCADYKDQAVKKIAAGMIVIGLAGAYVTIAKMNNAGGAVHMTDLMRQIIWCAVISVGGNLMKRGEKNGE